jgi:hypothetical protein
MKAHFFLTCFITTLIMLGADLKHLLPMYGLAACLWALFAWRLGIHTKRIEARRRRAYLYERYMWMQIRKGGY